MAHAERERRAEAIRVARARYRLTQEAIAQQAGLDQATISKAEAGRARDSTYDAIATAIDELTGVTP